MPDQTCTLGAAIDVRTPPKALALASRVMPPSHLTHGPSSGPSGFTLAAVVERRRVRHGARSRWPLAVLLQSRDMLRDHLPPIAVLHPRHCRAPLD